jgi:hypothetical protein
MFDDSSYLDTLREHERSHHPVTGGVLLVVIIALAVGLFVFFVG